jgi:hypothetical protein
METVIRISEENHGFIGIVKSSKDIIPFLAYQGWINGEKTTIAFLDDKKQWCNIPLKNLFGKDWERALSAMPLSVLSDFFDGRYYFLVEDVYCAEFY